MRRPARALLYLLLALAGLTACSKPQREFHDTQLIFGTLVETTLYDVDAATADKAFAILREDFGYLHFMWHPWQPGPLARTNELLALTAWFSANPSVLPVIERSRELSPKSHYLFNPAIGRLVELWGFHSDELPTGPPPDPRAIATLVRQNPTIDDIVIEGVRMKSTNPAVKLDVGAMAKGLAIDTEIEMLRKLGIRNAIINAGGDLKVLGRRGDRPWRVGIRHPRQPGVLAALDVHDGEAVFTSGDYERYYEYRGRRYHHILDPRTGYPADRSISVTVIHPDAATADAAATALFVAGPDEWLAVAGDMELRYVMLMDKQGRIHMTPAMAERLRFRDPPGTVLLGEPLRQNRAPEHAPGVQDQRE